MVKYKDKQRRSYIFGDFDDDGIPNIDDKYPFDRRRRQRAEETLLSNELRRIKTHVKMFKRNTKGLAKTLKGRGYEVKYRVKGVNSIVNKLRRKQLDKLQDIGGVMVLTQTVKGAYKVGKYIEQNYKIIDKENYFDEPKDLYYRALHYIVVIDDLPFEVQIKLKKDLPIHLKAHEKYKKGELDEAYNLRLLEEVMS